MLSTKSRNNRSPIKSKTINLNKEGLQRIQMMKDNTEITVLIIEILRSTIIILLKIEDLEWLQKKGIVIESNYNIGTGNSKIKDQNSTKLAEYQVNKDLRGKIIK